MPSASGKAGKPVEGLEAGDTVYVRHPARGAAIVRVLAVGKDGFQGDDETGARVKVRHSEYLGHKTRLLHTYSLVDEGADGVLVERGDGQRRFLRGELPKEQENSGGADRPGSDSDPLLRGLDDLLGKALRPLSPPSAWLLKAVATTARGRPGLVQRRITDRKGRTANRWVRANKDEPKSKPPAHKHGDIVKFRHGDIEGEGEIVGSGKDGVTVRDRTGREHQVRHDAISPPPDYPERGKGEDDKSYAKRAVDKMDKPDHVPEQHERYFNTDKATATLPIDQLVSTKSDAENAQGGENAPKRLLAAYHGKLAKRDPITVRKRADGKYEVVDGNGTFTAAKAAGWKSIPVQEEGGGEADQGALFDDATVGKLPASASQPAKTEQELFSKAPEAQAQLEEWLDKGKGVGAEVGAKTMKSSPSDTNLDEPGTMLFIAPPKSKARAKEKVEADYGGDWSKLIDPVRCSFACDSFGEIKTVLKALQASGMKMARRPKDRFNKPTEVGYRDCLINVVLPNGLIGEIQLHSKAMLKAKAEGHKWYEIERELAAKAQKSELSAEEKQKMLAAQQAQAQIYSEAWKAASASKMEGADMKKALNPTAQAYDYFEHDNAYFRRQTRNGVRAVDDVLHGDKWVPYTGDRLEPALYGDKVDDPLAGEAKE